MCGSYHTLSRLKSEPIGWLRHSLNDTCKRAAGYESCRLSRTAIGADLEGSKEEVSECLDGAEELFEGEPAAVLTEVGGQVLPLLLHR